MLGGDFVSLQVLERGWVLGGAKQDFRFLLGLYKNEVCFFISSFLAGKEAKEAGGTYDGSPLTPSQRSTGTLSPSIAPAQGDIFFVSRQAEVGKYRAGDVPPPRYRRGRLAGLRFSSSFWYWERV